MLSTWYDCVMLRNLSKGHSLKTILSLFGQKDTLQWVDGWTSLCKSAIFYYALGGWDKA